MSTDEIVVWNLMELEKSWARRRAQAARQLDRTGARPHGGPAKAETPLNEQGSAQRPGRSSI